MCHSKTQLNYRYIQLAQLAFSCLATAMNETKIMARMHAWIPSIGFLPKISLKFLYYFVHNHIKGALNGIFNTKWFSRPSGLR
jgi:predicted ATP-dependent Lon-type protease